MSVALTVIREDSAPVLAADMVMVTSWLSPAASTVGAFEMVKAASFEVTSMPFN